MKMLITPEWQREKMMEEQEENLKKEKQSASPAGYASDSRRVVGKWLNERTTACPPLTDIARLCAELDISNHALENIREFAGMIPLHTEDKHVSHYVDQIERWCKRALET